LLNTGLTSDETGERLWNRNFLLLWGGLWGHFVLAAARALLRARGLQR